MMVLRLRVLRAILLTSLLYRGLISVLMCGVVAMLIVRAPLRRLRAGLVNGRVMILLLLLGR